MSNQFPSISSLLPYLPNNDFDSWKKLLDRFQIGMLSKARRLLRTSGLTKSIDAEDLVQETFEKAWHHFHSFRGETTSQFAKWLLTIQRNTFLNHYRTQPSINHVEIDEKNCGGLSAEKDTPSKQLSSLEQEAKLHACIADLCPEDQRLLSMKHFEGLTFREIAGRLQMSASTICGKHNRAMLRLSKLMESDSCLAMKSFLDPSNS